MENFKEETKKYLNHTNEYFTLASNELGEKITKSGQKFLKDLDAIMVKHGFESILEDKKKKDKNNL